MKTENTMTAKQKAQQLIEKFRHYAHADFSEHYGWNKEELNENSRQCALILAEEQISSFSNYHGMHDQEFFNSELTFWQDVKKEISNCELDELSSMKKITTPIAKIEDGLNF